MKIIALLALCALCALCAKTARAEQWCISRTGRLRLRPAACFTTERPYHLGSGTAAPAIVDRNGALVGTLLGILNGYNIAYGSIFVTRQLDDGATIGFTVNTAGLVPPGSDVLYFAAAGCVGEPLILDYYATQHGFVKVGPTWPTVTWYPLVDTGRDLDVNALLFVETPGSAPCSDYPNGTEIDGGLCCLDTPGSGRFYTAARFAPADAGLEPPFRLSVEP